MSIAACDRCPSAIERLVPVFSRGMPTLVYRVWQGSVYVGVLGSLIPKIRTEFLRRVDFFQSTYHPR